MSSESKSNTVLNFIGRVLGALFGLLLIVGPWMAGYFWPWGIALGVCMLIGVASPELMGVFFGESAFMKSPRQWQQEAAERSNKLLGRDKKPVEEVSEEEVLKALSNLERKDR